MSYVQRCLNCGAEYDCAGYQPGAQFACAHCGGGVVVEQPAAYGAPQGYAQPGYGQAPQAQPDPYSYGASPARGPAAGRGGRAARYGQPGPGAAYGAYGGPQGKSKALLYVAAGAIGLVLIIAVVVSAVVLTGDDEPVIRPPEPIVRSESQIWAEDKYPGLARAAGDDVQKHYKLFLAADKYGNKDLAIEECRKVVTLSSEKMDSFTMEKDVERTAWLKQVLDYTGYEWVKYHPQLEKPDYFYVPYYKWRVSGKDGASPKWLEKGSDDYRKALADEKAFQEYIKDPRNLLIVKYLERTARVINIPEDQWAVKAESSYMMFLQKAGARNYDLMFDEYFNMLNNYLIPAWKKFTEPMTGISSVDDNNLQVFVLFKNKSAYQKYANEPNAAGHYVSNPGSEMMCGYQGGFSKTTVFHECAHQLHHASMPPDPAYEDRKIWHKLRRHARVWFFEGIATYFEFFLESGKGKDAAYQLGIINPYRLLEARMVLEQGALSLDAVLNVQLDMSDRTSTSLTYGGGWALTYFLNHGEGGKYRSAYCKFFSDVMNQRGGSPDYFKETLRNAGHDVAKFEEEWLAFIKGSGVR